MDREHKLKTIERLKKIYPDNELKQDRKLNDRHYFNLGVADLNLPREIMDDFWGIRFYKTHDNKLSLTYSINLGKNPKIRQKLILERKQNLAKLKQDKQRLVSEIRDLIRKANIAYRNNSPDIQGIEDQLLQKQMELNKLKIRKR